MDESAETQDVSFHHEIQNMMYACGDYRLPSPESAILLEEILRKQISGVVNLASEVAIRNGRRLISVQDVFFLLRRDKSKLKRAQRHMKIKEMAKKAKVATSSEEDAKTDTDLLKPSALRKAYSLEFLSSDEDSGSELDNVTIERLERNDMMTKTMNVKEYIEFAECRQIGFGGKNLKKFKEWLEPDSVTDTKIVEQTWDLLAYLAYDTLQQIVEMSLLVSKDMQLSTDPFTAHHLVVKRPSQSDDGGATAKRNKPDEETVPSGATSNSKPTDNEEKHYCDYLDPQPENVDLESSNHLPWYQHTPAIQPYHIREAIRRCHMPGGPLSCFRTHHMQMTTSRATVCL